MKRLLSIVLRSLLLFLLCTDVSVSAADNATIHANLTPVIESIRSGNHDAAIGTLENLIRENPDEYRYEEILGQVLLLTNRAPDSIPHLERAGKLMKQGSSGNRRERLNLALAIAHYIVGNYTASERYLSEITSAGDTVPSDVMVQALNQLGMIREEAKDYQAAMDIYALAATQFNSTEGRIKVREMEDKLHFKPYIQSEAPAEDTSASRPRRPSCPDIRQNR